MTTPTIEDDIAALSAAIDAETTLVYIGQEMRDSIARLIAALQEAREELSQPARVGLTQAEIDEGCAEACYNSFKASAFYEGVRFAEERHNIPAAQEGR